MHLADLIERGEKREIKPTKIEGKIVINRPFNGNI